MSSSKGYSAEEVKIKERQLEEKAQGGEKGAQYRFATWLEWNRDNPKEAIVWYERAAQQGHKGAAHALIFLQEKGNYDRVEKVDWQTLNITKAWYEKEAEEKQDADARVRLGYYHGSFVLQGVYDDIAHPKAFGYYNQAATQGHAEAQYQIGSCHDYSLGVGQDLGRAIEFYTLAAAQGHSYAQYTLAGCYEKGRGVDKDLKKAIGLYQELAHGGDILAKEKVQKLMKETKSPLGQGKASAQEGGAAAAVASAPQAVTEGNPDDKAGKSENKGSEGLQKRLKEIREAREQREEGTSSILPRDANHRQEVLSKRKLIKLDHGR